MIMNISLEPMRFNPLLCEAIGEAQRANGEAVFLTG
jgi:hypothetical protein